MNARRYVFLLWAVLIVFPRIAVAEPAKASLSRVVVHGQTVELRSPTFEFVLSTADQLRAVSWKNRLTGRTLNLGNGLEVEFDIGLPGQALVTPKLTMKNGSARTIEDGHEAAFDLVSADPAVTARVTYRWNDREPVLHKWVSITNSGKTVWDRLLNVRLGVYRTDATKDDHDPDFPLYLTQEHLGGPVVAFEDPIGRKRGFPSYVEGQFFLSLAHPAGFALRKDKTVTLQQLPGFRLAPGATFDCMEAVYGVAAEGQARQAFVKQLHDRMLRVRRGRDKPLAIFEPFGSKADGNFDATEAYLLDNLAKVDKARRESGLKWDYYSIEFWHDPAADLSAPNVRNFPNGFAKIMREITRQGMRSGLWIDSGQIGGWTIWDNPAVKNARTSSGGLCRASEVVSRLYLEGYTRQIKENSVRLFKFDNLLDRCDEANHEHLPGDYSTEPICNHIIQLYRDMDRLCPDVMIMLYWRYQSPWWLEHADTLFDIGTKIEAASFAPWPTFRARDSVTRRLDEARWMVKDLPLVGWDPLGIWLSDWPWNSCVGKEAWQTGMAMDLCRGHLLAQIWSDGPVLTPPERAQAAEFIALLKARPECFGNSRFILGNPWKNEPYGYCCSDGRRAFLAINNGVWRDTTVELNLGPAWGLPEGKRWDLYRWYPRPAQLRESEQGLASSASLTLQAMEIVLLEVVPHGEAPTLNRKFDVQPMPTAFAEPSSTLALQAKKPSDQQAAEWKTIDPAEKRFQYSGEVPPTKLGGILTVSVELKQGAHPLYIHHRDGKLKFAANLNGKLATFQPVVANGWYQAAWQSWRLPLSPSEKSQPFDFQLHNDLPADVEYRISAHFVPEYAVSAAVANYSNAPQDAVDAWRQWKFGALVQWNMSSFTEQEIGWARGGRRWGLEWTGTGGVSVQEYDSLYKKFKAEKFDAMRICKTLKGAGMRYAMFCNKHHDGFCMWDSKLTDYKITSPLCPAGRDFTKEWADACRASGLKHGVYFSQPDWHHPDFVRSEESQRRFIKTMHGWVRELLTNYGQVDVIFFDGLGGLAANWDSQDLFPMIRRLQPSIMVNCRCGAYDVKGFPINRWMQPSEDQTGNLPMARGFAGDFDTPEQTICRMQTDRPWETCMPLQNFNGQWSYSSKAEMKSLKEVLQTLVNVVGRDGNLMVSPPLMPDGSMAPHAEELLAGCGRWLAEYGASIYDTRGGPYYPTPFGVCTYRGDTIFVHLLNWPGDTLTLPPIQRKLVSSQLLTGGKADVRQKPDGSIEIAVPREHRQDIDTIVALKLDGPAKEAKPGRMALGSLATGRSVRASNVFGNNRWFAAQNAVDDDAYTRWTTDFATKEAWLEVDLGEEKTFNCVAIKEDMDLIRKFEVQVKQGDQWIAVLKGATIGDNFRKVFAPVTARYVRLVILDAITAPQLPATLYDCNSHMVAFPGPSIREFQVLADQRQATRTW